MKFFDGFDFTNFWAEDDSFYKREEYPGDQKVKEIEDKTGYKFPESYLWLMKQHNGGAVAKNNQFFDEILSAQDSLAEYEALVGEGTWNYPDIGMPVCHCPSDVHDAYFFDYQECGKDGEPAVVHIDQEDEFEITHIANSFEEFIRSLVFGEAYDKAEAINEAFNKKVRNSKLIAFIDVAAKILLCLGFITGFVIGLGAVNIVMGLVFGIVFAAVIAFIWIKIDDKIKNKLKY